MEDKKKFLAEFEIQENYIPKYFYYVSTADGLSRWFADDVKVIEEKVFRLIWNRKVHYAKIIKQKPNKYIKFEFLNENQESESNPSILDISFQKNGITETWYCIVDEYSNFSESQEEFTEDWQELSKKLTYLVTNELV